MKRLGIIFINFALLLSLFFIPQTKVNARLIQKAGYYYTYAQKRSGSYNYDKMSIKKVIIKSRIITTYGSYDYMKSLYGGGRKRIKNKKRTFRIASNCKYWTAWGVPGGNKRTSKRAFNKDLKRFSKFVGTGQCFIIHVKNGKAVDMMLGQG